MSKELEDQIKHDVDVAIDLFHAELNKKYPGYMNSCAASDKTAGVDLTKSFEEFEEEITKAVRWHLWIQ